MTHGIDLGPLQRSLPRISDSTVFALPVPWVINLLIQHCRAAEDFGHDTVPHTRMLHCISSTKTRNPGINFSFYFKKFFFNRKITITDAKEKSEKHQSCIAGLKEMLPFSIHFLFKVFRLLHSCAYIFTSLFLQACSHTSSADIFTSLFRMTAHAHSSWTGVCALLSCIQIQTAICKPFRLRFGSKF